jgi:uncharacterized membrane protein
MIIQEVKDRLEEIRKIAKKDYEDALADVMDKVNTAYFVICNHDERYSPGWNNDKILVLVKA